jgi:hypothetical protein
VEYSSPGNASYTLAEVERALQDIFGKYGTELIIERINRILGR